MSDSDCSLGAASFNVNFATNGEIWRLVAPSSKFGLFFGYAPHKSHLTDQYESSLLSNMHEETTIFTFEPHLGLFTHSYHIGKSALRRAVEALYVHHHTFRLLRRQLFVTKHFVVTQFRT